MHNLLCFYIDVVRLLSNYPESLNLEIFELDLVPLDELYYLGDHVKGKSMWTIRELVHFLHNSYSNNVGIEFAHVENDIKRNWLENKIEKIYGPNQWNMSRDIEVQKQTLDLLMKCDHTGQFFSDRFPRAKVFGVAGCEALLPGLWSILESSVSHGIEVIEVGMAHRGRMNMLVNFFQKDLAFICSQFKEVDAHVLSDVKFHLGARARVQVPYVDPFSPVETRGVSEETRPILLSLAANPSHLEMVNPIVLGKCKATQFAMNDMFCKRVMPILIHGDASFAGQGIVTELMQLSQIHDYTVGGCIHIVINNQIGFTTEPNQGRSSFHCTNAAKAVEAPIFHVNSDDIDAVRAVCSLAVEWRQQFGSDVVIDIVGYRRYGHNSLEDPSITQPLMYKMIAEHTPSLQIYADRLIADGIITQEYYDECSKSLYDCYEEAFERAKSIRHDDLQWLSSNWQVIIFRL